MAGRLVTVYGGFPARVGPAAVLSALRAGFPDAHAIVTRLPGDDADRLYFRTDRAAFGTQFVGEMGYFLFDGTFDGPSAEAATFVSAMSDRLATAGLEHEFHVHTDAATLVASFRYPPEPPEPAEPTATPDRGG